MTAVWLRIYDVDESSWPFSETVVVKGTTPAGDLAAIAAPLQPREVWVETPGPVAGRRSSLPGAVRVLSRD